MLRAVTSQAVKNGLVVCASTSSNKIKLVSDVAYAQLVECSLLNTVDLIYGRHYDIVVIHFRFVLSKRAARLVR